MGASGRESGLLLYPRAGLRSGALGCSRGMATKIKVTQVQVVHTRNGSDLISLQTKVPGSVRPVEMFLHVRKGSGENWVQKNLESKISQSCTVLDENEHTVLSYLVGVRGFMSPTSIGRGAGQKKPKSAATWANKILQKMAGRGLWRRNSRGKYSATKRARDLLGRPWLEA
jgi:hypothetical protein